jgi:phosphatidylglycerol:prolipoprotein diacylglycerol transferase
MHATSLLLGLGTLTGLLLACWRAPQKELPEYLDAGFWVLVGALIGSRIGSVLVNFTYFQAHPGEAFQVWEGGLSGIGALVGGSVAIFVVARWKKIPTVALADVLFPLAGTLMVTAWMGCWVSSCAYGLPSEAWWALPARDELGVLDNRIPVQLAGATLTLALLFLLELAGKRFPVPGSGALTGLLLLSAEILASFLRLTPPHWLGLRLEAWAGALLVAATGGGIIGGRHRDVRTAKSIHHKGET